MLSGRGIQTLLGTQRSRLISLFDRFESEVLVDLQTLFALVAGD